MKFKAASGAAIVGVVGVMAAFVMAAFLVGRLWAAGIPATGALTYSGTLEDATGAPLTGMRAVEALFWSTPAVGTTPLCLTPPNTVTLTAGRFSLPLPETCTAAVQGNRDVWVEVRVDGQSLGLSKLGAVPYAVEAGHATSSDNATAAAGAAAAVGALDTRLNAMMPPKSIITANLTAADVTSNFDATGLGRNPGSYAGWAICNGSNGTPNLAGRFVRINAAASGALGGSDTIAAHTHAIDHDHAAFTSGAEAEHTHLTPDHQHFVPIGFDGNNVFFNQDAMGNPVYGSIVAANAHTFMPQPSNPIPTNTRLATTDNSGHGTTGAGTAHSHAVDPPAFTGTSGPSPASDNRPAYLELVALMRL